MSAEKIGVLVMSYGTPESLDQVEAYYTHIRRGNPPSPEQLKELTDRYAAIVGGFFPLRQNTDNQFKGIQAMLDELAPGKYVCYQGLKHAYPFVEDGVEQMAKDGIKKAVGIVLAPHYSSMSVGSYTKRADEAAAKFGIALTNIKNYHLNPLLIEALVKRVQDGIAKFSLEERVGLKVLFTAHSLPTRILEIGDPYPEQLLETSRAIAKDADVSNWQFGWQSAGQTGVPWLGPDIMDVLRTLKEEEGVSAVLVCPIGFVSDHLEVLYDLDIEAQDVAKEIGMHLERTAMLNTDPLYMRLLADEVMAV
jgi:ferrochelatase